jgi:antitoxin MazE
MKIMEISIIKIGNSKGIRLPKTVLEKYEINETINLVMEKDCIVLRPVKEPRKGWDLAFKKMHQNEEDQLLINDVFTEEDFEEWS